MLAAAVKRGGSDALGARVGVTGVQQGMDIRVAGGGYVGGGCRVRVTGGWGGLAVGLGSSL